MMFALISLPAFQHHIWSDHKLNPCKVLNSKVDAEPNDTDNPTNQKA